MKLSKEFILINYGSMNRQNLLFLSSLDNFPSSRKSSSTLCSAFYFLLAKVLLQQNDQKRKRKGRVRKSFCHFHWIASNLFIKRVKCRRKKRSKNTKTRALVKNLTRWRQSSWGSTRRRDIISLVSNLHTQKPHTEWFNTIFASFFFPRCALQQLYSMK